MVLSLSTVPEATTSHGDPDSLEAMEAAIIRLTEQMLTIVQCIASIQAQIQQIQSGTNVQKSKKSTSQPQPYQNSSQVQISSAIQPYQNSDMEIQEPENPENSQEKKNPETQPQQQQEAGSDPTKIQIQIQKQHSNSSISEFKHIIPDSKSAKAAEEQSGFTSQVQTQQQQQQQQVPDQAQFQIQNLDLRSGRLDADNEKSASSNVGADVTSSGAAVGASEKGKVDDSAASSLTAVDRDSRTGAEDGAFAERTEQTTSSDEDLRSKEVRTRLFRRVSPIVAKPPRLLAAAFPWNREYVVQAKTAAGELQMHKDLRRDRVTGVSALTVDGEITTTIVGDALFLVREMRGCAGKKEGEGTVCEPPLPRVFSNGVEEEEDDAGDELGSPGVGGGAVLPVREMMQGLSW